MSCESCIEKLRDLFYDWYGKDYLLTWEKSEDELRAVAHVAQALEDLHKRNISCRAFEGGLAVSNFRDKSTRTRFSFASAASLLGLSVQEIDESKSQVAHGETVRETANMISFLAETIGIRDDLFIHEGHEYQQEVAEAITEGAAEGVLPSRPVVVNLQCDRDHPTQSMADLLHLAEYFGGIDKIRGKKIAVTWAYSPSYGKPLSVPQALITLLPRFGAQVTLAHPEGYDLLPDIVETAKELAEESGGSLRIASSMAEAFEGADIVYPKSWAPFTVMEKRTQLLRAGGAGAAEMEKLEKECIANNDRFRSSWECTEELMALTNNAMYMHCLPADITGVSCKHGEVAASVFERHRIATYKEAGHKPYVIAAVMLLSRFRDVPGLLESFLSRGIVNLKEGVPRPITAPPAEPKKHPADTEEVTIFEGITWPTGLPEAPLDARVAELAEKYTPLACEILKEAIRIPEDHYAEDDHCGMSNHEGPRLEYLRKRIVEVGAVEKPEDVFFDEFGNIVWVVEDREDLTPNKKVIFFDGHTDTVAPLPEEWKRKIGEGMDVYRGLIDPEKVDMEFLRSELGYLPPVEEWKHLIFGRGSADQLSGVISQIIATKIMLELKGEGALRGVVIRSYGTVAEEDNDGGGPMHVMRKFLVQKENQRFVPDVVVHTEGTGDKRTSACGIYIGQRGRMQIEVCVVGRSSHGSMPWEGRNPLEYAADIISEAAKKYKERDGFLHDDFLGGGTRTASWCSIATPSDCAVPASFTFRFDRRLTVGETPDQAVRDIESLRAVKVARAAGLQVDVRIPRYEEKTWVGCTPGNPQVYPGWLTPPQHEAVQSAYDTWKRTVTRYLPADFKETSTSIPREPRVSRWIFSTDGVGYPLRVDDDSVPVAPSKDWVVAGEYHHPAMIGMGIGFEQNTHKLGEFIDARHFPAAIAFMSRFPSLYAKRSVELRRGSVQNILVMGKSGAGKQPRIDVLCEEFGLEQLSTGNIFREYLGQFKRFGFKGDTAQFYDEAKGEFIADEEIMRVLGEGATPGVVLGCKAVHFIDRGLFVPDSITNAMFESYFGEMGFRGAVLDGYPRTVDQARFLMDLVRRKGTRLNAIVLVDNEDEAIVKRTVGRRICPKCGKVFHMEFKPPREGKFCTACSTEVILRSDDSEEKIRSRLGEFQTKAVPAMDFLTKEVGVPVAVVPGNLPVFTDEAVRASVLEGLTKLQ